VTLIFIGGCPQFAIDGKEIVVKAGEVLCIPSNMPHEAWALEDTIDLDVFNPPRGLAEQNGPITSVTAVVSQPTLPPSDGSQHSFYFSAACEK